jgi:hypothetical protein
MKTLFTILVLCVLISPEIASAQYQTLVGIPGVDSGGGDFDAYLQAVYATSISLAALLAVIKIVIAGVKWMTSDIVSTKSDAKKDIEGAILGLVVILAAVLILYIINPNIGAVSLNFAPAPQPAPVAIVPPESITDRIDTCANSPTCEIAACESVTVGGGRAGETTSHDCSSAVQRCIETLNGAPQTLGTTVLCIGAGSGSVVEGEYDIGQDMIRNFFNENSDDYIGVVDTYSINQRDYRENRDLTPTELQENIEVWAEECEETSDGNSTGNEFIELEDSQNSIIVRFCAQESSS